MSIANHIVCTVEASSADEVEARIDAILAIHVAQQTEVLRDELRLSEALYAMCRQHLRAAERKLDNMHIPVT